MYRRKLDNVGSYRRELRRVIAHPSNVLRERTIAAARKQYSRTIMATDLCIPALIGFTIDERRCPLSHPIARYSAVRPELTLNVKKRLHE